MKSKLLSFGVLLMMFFGSAIYFSPAFAQGVVSSSTSQSTVQTSTALQTVNTSQSFTFMASHVVQPFGKYKVTPTGTIYAANGVDNVTITMTSGFPSFSGYQANATIQQFSSGCQKVVNKQSGANLVMSYEGTLCGVAPTLRLTFSPLPTSLTSCSISWKAETYSWCGDSGISYGGGVVMIVPSSATYDIDPTIVQSATANCAPVSGTTCSFNTGSNVNAGNVLILSVTFYASTSSQTITKIQDSFTTLTQAVATSQSAAGIGVGYYIYSQIWYEAIPTSGADTVAITFGTGSVNTNVFVYYYEVSSLASSPSSTASGNGLTAISPFVTSTTPSYLANAFVVGAGIAYGTGCGSSNIGAGSGFTFDSMGFTYTGSEHLISSGSGSTNFPFTFSCAGTVDYADTGAIFVGEIAQKLLFIETVNAPPCGAIEIGAATTISTVSTLTITSTTSWTQSQVAFSGCINYGWSGATTFQQDTINPTQTEAITTLSSYTTSSTVTSTLTAGESTAGATTTNNTTFAGGTTTSGLDVIAVFGLFIVLAVAVFALSKDRR